MPAPAISRSELTAGLRDFGLRKGANETLGLPGDEFAVIAGAGLVRFATAWIDDHFIPPPRGV